MQFAALSSLSNVLSVDWLLNKLIMVLILCVSLSFHERSHAWAAYKLGDDTAALQGRLSLNPLVHLDLIGSIAFIIGGIGWAKPVPINPIRFNRKYSMKTGLILTSVVGPLSNLFLAVIAIFVYYTLVTVFVATGAATDGTVVTLLLQLFSMFYFYNIILAVFNLLPVPPLDGFKVFGAVLPNKIYYKLMQYERYIGLAFLLLVFMGGGILSSILNVIIKPFNIAIEGPVKLLFQWIWQITGLA
jgi:Zn-dependent protease